MPAEAIRINRRVLLQCSIGAPGLKQPFAQPQQNGALSAKLPDGQMETKVWFSPIWTEFRRLCHWLNPPLLAHGFWQGVYVRSAGLFRLPIYQYEWPLSVLLTRLTVFMIR